MSHDVPIDEAAIGAALDAHATAPATSPAPAMADPQAPAANPDAWRPVAQLVSSFLAHKVCPNWSVPTDVQQQWADALAECADRLMPGGLDNIEKWGPWGKLLFASGAWMLCGFDMERFGFKPLTPPPPQKKVERIEGQGETPPAQQTAPSGSYTTSG